MPDGLQIGKSDENMQVFIDFPRIHGGANWHPRAEIIRLVEGKFVAFWGPGSHNVKRQQALNLAAWRIPSTKLAAIQLAAWRIPSKKAINSWYYGLGGIPA